MKAKNILMSILLAVGSIAAKAATGYPPELALVSQPVMVYNYNSITVYYDVENIGDYTYRGNVYLYLDPDYGYYYANKYVRVRPGSIKRIAISIPSHRIDRGIGFTVMPYYELGDELYSFTTFEYFEPISFYWAGPRTERWVVISAPPRVHYYTRPGIYRYYYDGYRPPMPPPPGHGPGTPPPPMNPMHHTYGYHSNNGGYPATHPEVNSNPPAAPSNSETAPSATVRPKANGGSLSSGSSHSGTSTGSASGNGSNSGRIGSSSTSRPSGTSTGSATGSSGRTGNTGSSSSRVGNGASTGSATGRTGNSSPSSRVNGSSSNSRPSGTSTGSATTRSSSSSSSSRVNSGSSSTRSSGTSTGSATTRSSNSSGASTGSATSSSSTRSGSGSGRR